MILMCPQDNLLRILKSDGEEKMTVMFKKSHESLLLDRSLTKSMRKERRESFRSLILKTR